MQNLNGCFSRRRNQLKLWQKYGPSPSNVVNILRYEYGDYNMNWLTTLVASAAVTVVAGVASASTVFFDESGGSITPATAGAGDPISFTETQVGSGGEYTLTNNILNGIVWGFGVTNPGGGTIAVNNSSSGCCGEATVLDEDNWATTVIDTRGANVRTAFDVFGDISNVLDQGETVVHWYTDLEVGYANGTHMGFVFFNGQLASNVVGIATITGTPGTVGFGPGPATTTPNPAPVPLPASGLLLIAGLGGLALRKPRKS